MSTLRNINSAIDSLWSTTTTKLSSKNKNIGDLSEDVQELNDIIAQKNAEIGALNEIISDKDSEISELNVTVANKDSEISELNETITEKNATIEEMTFGYSVFENRLQSENWRCMFLDSSISTVPLFDTSHVTTMYAAFQQCKSLVNVPPFNTSNVTNMYSMFGGCVNLTSVPLLDTSKVTNTNYMFNGCAYLTTVPAFDIRNVNNCTSMLVYCYRLTDCYLRNIKSNLQVGSNDGWGHLLTLDSLKHLIYELRDTGSPKTLTVSSTSLEKLADVYVKVIDITDEMRAEDDLIDEKLPYVVCESTDEGAMLITDYVLLKNWSITQ